MTDLQVIDAARALAAKFNIRLDARGILENMQTHGNQTTIVSCGGVTVWIDRYYISFSRDDSIDVHYAYLSHSHIREELPSVMKRLKKAKTMNDYILLAGIKRQLLYALSKMNARGSNDYMFESFDETHSWEGWDDGYASAMAD